MHHKQGNEHEEIRKVSNEMYAHAYAFMQRENLEVAKELFRECIALRERIPNISRDSQDRRFLEVAYEDVSYVYSRLGMPREQIRASKHANEILSEMNFSGKSSVYNMLAECANLYLIAWAYGDCNQPDKALQYCLKAIAHFELLEKYANAFVGEEFDDARHQYAHCLVNVLHATGKSDVEVYKKAIHLLEGQVNRRVAESEKILKDFREELAELTIKKKSSSVLFASNPAQKSKKRTVDEHRIEEASDLRLRSGKVVRR